MKAIEQLMLTAYHVVLVSRDISMWIEPCCEWPFKRSHCIQIESPSPLTGHHITILVFTGKSFWNNSCICVVELAKLCSHQRIFYRGEKVKLAISGLRIFLGWPDIHPMCCCLKVKHKFVTVHMKTLEYFFHAFFWTGSALAKISCLRKFVMHVDTFKAKVENILMGGPLSFSPIDVNSIL